MPGKDGIQATREVRELLTGQGVRREEQPVILGVTGHAHDKFKVEGQAAGMDDVLSKPIYFKVMKGWIDKVL